MSQRTLLLLLLAACGGAAASSHSEAPKKSAAELAREARQRELGKLDAEQPKLPYELQATHAFKAARDCGQGPFRVEAKSLGAKYGERFDVYACAPRGLQGHARFVLDGKDDDVQSFGFADESDDRCHATVAELARGSDAGASATAAPASTPKGRAGRAAKPAAPKAEHLEETPVTIASGMKCPDGMGYVWIASHAYASNMGAPLRAGLPMHVEVWSDEPNDLRGVVFVVRQYGIDPKTTAEQWADLQRREDAWYARFAAFEKSNRDLFVYDDGGAAKAEAPPPARAETEPPKPSVHAEWVPGYYHRSGASWLWIAGWWRVPDEDVKRDLTTVAPSAPPPPREERVVTATAPGAVWARGGWQWDGARWVWVAGGWRLPPQPNVVWHAPQWAPRGVRFVFVPGGWARRR